MPLSGVHYKVICLAASLKIQVTQRYQYLVFNLTTGKVCQAFLSIRYSCTDFYPVNFKINFISQSNVTLSLSMRNALLTLLHLTISFQNE